MKFTATPLAGAYVIDVERIEDARGFFARTVCRSEFAQHGLNADFIQQSISWNQQRGILRGLHYQEAPHGEDKLVRVTQGAIFDVIVDMRPQSQTYRSSFSVELTADNRRALYIPQGFAHGFQTLVDATEILYEMTVEFRPEAARGIRWNDPALAINWPDPARAVLSAKDLDLPMLSAP